MDFKPSRKNGYSDRVVIYELVKNAQPDDLFTYPELESALLQELDGPIPKSRIYQAIGAANRTFLKEKQRYLSVVRKEGYRVIQAREGVLIAKRKKISAEASMRRGYNVLINMRRDEMTPAERDLQEGTLLMMNGLLMAMQQSDARHQRTESLIEGLVRRVEDLESKQ